MNEQRMKAIEEAALASMLATDSDEVKLTAVDELAEHVRLMQDADDSDADLRVEVSLEIVMGEIEKLEGKVPSTRQIAKHGTQKLIDKAGTTQYYWKGVLLLTVKPNQLDPKSGQRGTLLEINQVIEPKPDDGGIPVEEP